MLFGIRQAMEKVVAKALARPLTHVCYRQLVAPLQLPTNAQLNVFADFVSTAHSWYKHLPLLPPGQLFNYFLDPAAGMDLVHMPDGALEVKIRAEQGFHYSSLPTADYRRRFACMSFTQLVGTAVFLINPDGGQAALTAIVARCEPMQLDASRAEEFTIENLHKSRHIHWFGPKRGPGGHCPCREAQRMNAV